MKQGQEGLLLAQCRKLFLIVLSMILASSILLACGVSAEQEEPPYVSPYSWERLVEESGRYNYYDEDLVVASRFGIDVSEHQGLIDWQAVAADGVEFAFIRLGNRGATEGQLYLDEHFEANLTGAKQAGLLVGVYFFSQALDETEALEEAEFVLEHLAGRSLDYPVAFDHEPVTSVEGTSVAGRANRISRKDLTLCARSFCEVIEAAGLDTMLYGNTADLAMFDEVLLDSSALWFAQYEVSRPTLEHDFVIWQYTSSGTVAGIDTYTDLNIHFLAPE